MPIPHALPPPAADSRLTFTYVPPPQLQAYEEPHPQSALDRNATICTIPTPTPDMPAVNVQQTWESEGSRASASTQGQRGAPNGHGDGNHNISANDIMQRAEHSFLNEVDELSRHMERRYHLAMKFREKITELEKLEAEALGEANMLRRQVEELRSWGDL